MGFPLRREDLPGADAPDPGMMHRSLTVAQFDRFSRLLHKVCGIDLQPGKEQLVKARLWKRIHHLGLSGFDDYLHLVESPEGACELSTMVDALTTNKTSFFREAQHFDLLRQQARAALQTHGKLRLWSAGCSSGQEPYTMAIILHESIPGVDRQDVQILATDISSKILQEARAATYDAAALDGVPAAIQRRYFLHHVEQRTSNATYTVVDPVRSMVRFARLNLMDPWPMRGTFDFIFCRNVMIYFDAETQRALIDRFYEVMRPGGYLFVGHSESLSGKAGAFQYRMPACYQKPVSMTSA